MEREGISMKKDDFTEEELKALYRDFLENDIEPAPDSVREAYRAMRNAFEEYLCAIEEDIFINGFLYGRRNRVPEIKEGSITYPRDEQEFVHQWLDALDDPDEADEIGHCRSNKSGILRRAGSWEKGENIMMILGYPVIGEFKIRENVSLPLVDIPMMPDEEWKRLSAAQAIKNFIRENGREPEDAEEAFQWQYEWISNMEDEE